MAMKLNNDKRYFLNILSAALAVYGAAMLSCAAAAFADGENRQFKYMLAAGLICSVTGLAGIRLLRGRQIREVQPRMWYFTTLFVWLIVIAATAAVFRLCVPELAFADALMHSVSSWTTTGIGWIGTAELPYALMLLHSVCSWLGGLGVILTAAAFMPGMRFRILGAVCTEFPGPTFLKLNPVFRRNLGGIFLMYACFTATEFILLLAAGMDLKNSVLTALSGISTSGLTHLEGGSILLLSVPARVIITIFTFAGSVSLTAFPMVCGRRLAKYRHDGELGFYAARIIVTAAAISSILILGSGVSGIRGGDIVNTAAASARIAGESLMQTVSYLSTSGYIAADTGSWNETCRMIILLQMLIGACALSTGGGIKVSRIIIALKTASISIFRHIHPRAVRSLTLSGEPLRTGHIVRANLFIAMFLFTFLAGALILSADGSLSMDQALNYSQAMITNTGTYAGEAGTPDFSVLSRLVMCALMLAGRLEIYPVIMVFMRDFWSKESKQ